MEKEEFFEIEDNSENSNQRKSLGAITNSFYNDDNSQENSKIKLDDINNKNEKNIEYIKDLSNNSLFKSNNYKNNLLQSEEIFINQKKEILKAKEKKLTFLKNKNNKNNNLNLSKNIENNDINDDIKTFSLNDNKYFEVSIFNYNEIDEEKPQIPEFNEPWKPSNLFFSYFSEKEKSEKTENYLEFSRIALRSNKEIDYSKNGLELDIKFNLFGDSELWIFSRCSVNKSINESYYFDEKSENIEDNDYFNKYSSVIKIKKVRNSNKCFVIFGTFYQEINDNNNLYYKSFLKRQLIDNSGIEKSYDYYYYNKNDKCEFELILTDYGDELINTKIYLNNKNIFNDINARFFLPINKKAKFIISGSGQSVQIKDLVVKILEKEKNNFKSVIQFESENDTPKNCECCSIF